MKLTHIVQMFKSIIPIKNCIFSIYFLCTSHTKSFIYVIDYSWKQLEVYFQLRYAFLFYFTKIQSTLWCICYLWNTGLFQKKHCRYFYQIYSREVFFKLHYQSKAKVEQMYFSSVLLNLMYYVVRMPFMNYILGCLKRTRYSHLHWIKLPEMLYGSPLEVYFNA